MGYETEDEAERSPNLPAIESEVALGLTLHAASREKADTFLDEQAHV